MPTGRLDHARRDRNGLLFQRTNDLGCIDTADAVATQDSVHLGSVQVTRLLRSRRHLEDFPEPGVGVDVPEFQKLRVVPVQLLPQAVAKAEYVLLEVLTRSHQGA